MFKKYSIAYALDDPRTTLAHRDIILQKKFLKRLYEDWYKSMFAEMGELAKGKVLEIGSGGGFLKELYPNVITSDILALPNVDQVFSAEELPFKDTQSAQVFKRSSTYFGKGWKNRDDRACEFCAWSFYLQTFSPRAIR